MQKNEQKKPIRQRQNSNFKESIYIKPGEGVKSIHDMYKNFDGIPGLNNSFLSISDVQSIDMTGVSDDGTIGIKEWGELALCCILASCFAPLMVCLPQPSFYKLFWLFLIVRL